MSDPRDDLAALIDRVFDEFEPAAVRDEISDAILAAGWRAPVPHCDHDWSADRSAYGGNPWRECNLCGKQEWRLVPVDKAHTRVMVWVRNQEPTNICNACGADWPCETAAADQHRAADEHTQHDIDAGIHFDFTIDMPGHREVTDD